MDETTIPAEKAARLRKLRRDSLLLRYARGGKLSGEERAEIADLLPALSDGSEVDAAITPSPAARSSTLRYSKPLRDYTAIYDTTLRPIKGWIAVGKAAVDEKGQLCPDLPPLDEPPLMAAWWGRRMKQRVPPKLLALAVVEAAPAGETHKTESVDVASINVESLDSLRQAKRYLSAIDKKLSAAYSAGDQSQIRIWQKPFNEALESVRKLEAAQREADKAAGDLIPKSELFADLSQLLELLRQMRSSMRRRIASRLTDLAPELLERIGAAIDAEREGEDTVLRQLKQFRSIEEVHFQLEGAVT